MTTANSEKLDDRLKKSSLMQFVQSRIVLLAKKVGCTILGVHLIFLFILHRYYSGWRRSFIFAHYLHWPEPFQIDFKKPQNYNLGVVRNFYLPSEENVKIGVWQILPISSNPLQSDSPELYDECLGNGKPIIVYAHGNAGDRGSTHRLELYRLLREHDYHVIAFDYRSFGDSSSVSPDEEGVVKDTITVIMWIVERKKSTPIFVWGHSLGTGVSARAIKILEERNIFVDGLILESPFNNLRDEIRSHPLGMLMKHMIGFDYLFVQPLLDDGISFRSDEYLSQCRVPVLILHAENDWIVPANLGRRLYKYLKKHRDDSQNIRHVKFRNNYGHKGICKCPSLLELIRLFVERNYDEIPSIIVD